MNARTVAALCVSRRSVYKSIYGVEAFDVIRDARTFAGGMPIVAHPPCRAWSATCAHQSKATPEEKALTPWAVDQLRQWGGVLEHPAGSRLWAELDLPKPGEPERGGLWALALDQFWFGDTRPKKTWLLFAGVSKGEIEYPLRLRVTGEVNAWDKLSKTRRAATSPAMAFWLVDIARRSRVPSQSPRRIEEVPRGLDRLPTMFGD
jgi:hypothetical protein